MQLNCNRHSAPQLGDDINFFFCKKKDAFEHIFLCYDFSFYIHFLLSFNLFIDYYYLKYRYVNIEEKTERE